MPGLPATGELSYNGHLFDGATHIDVALEFVYDEAHRTIIAHKHKITVKATLASTTMDSDVFDIRKRLGESGKRLKFVSKGFGDDLDVSATGRTRDVMSGPHPSELSWVSLGDDQAAEIVWSVEVTVAVCGPGRSAGATRLRGPMALNYGATYVINSHGDTTRTLTGYIQISQSVVNRRARDTADRYRDSFSPDGISGFTREWEWTNNFAKSRVDFVIVDTQIPSANPYPVGIVAIDARHRVSWRRGPKGGLRYFNTITARITPEARLSGAQAWGVFLSLVTKRMEIAVRRGKSVFLDSLEVEEGIFSRSHNFSATYRFLSSIGDFIGDSGLWTPLGTNWDLWRASLGNSMFNNRGNRQLRDLPGNDVIVNLCESPATISPNNLQEFEEFVTPVSAPARRSPGLRNETPPAKTSFVEYESVIIPERTQNPIAQRVLQEIEDLAPGEWLLEEAKDPPDEFSFPQSSKVIPDVIQIGGAASYRVRLVGRAKRAGHKIPRPAIVKFGDQPVTEVRGIFPQRVVGNFFGVPVYEAAWNIEYLVGSSPGSVIPLADPAEGVRPLSNTTEQPSLGTTT